MSSAIERRSVGVVFGGALIGLVTAGLSSVSCIIPDHGIVTLIDCGARWCASAPFAEALDGDEMVVVVQEPKPGGGVGWVTECLCMTPEQDLTLQLGMPYMQYELLRIQVLDAARQRCIDAATASGYDADPPFPQDGNLDPSCTEAVVSVFRDGCCAVSSDQCGGINTCEAVGTGGNASGGVDSGEGDSADGTTGEMLSSLEALYGEIDCAGATCHIGQSLIDAMLHNPEAVLAEGTSLRFASGGSEVAGLQLHGVEPEGLAWRLGLREGDLVLRVDGLSLRDEAEVFTAMAQVHDAEQVAVVVLRDGVEVQRRFVRVRGG